MPNIGKEVNEPDGGSAVVDDRRTDAASDGGNADGTPGSEQVVLAAENLAKTYGSPIPFTRSVEVLDGASLSVRAGEVVGIVGENGSGKSTLMKILVGALEADGGTIDRAGTVGWCPQETLLYDRLTVRETFRLFGRAYGMDEAAIREARDRYAERLDFERFLDYRIEHLSGGNRQKVNLSVALLHDPDVLLLDEPYTGFDWETYLAFWDLTEDLRDRGTAVVIISHLVSERERFDRILELVDGELRADGGDRPSRNQAHGLEGGAKDGSRVGSGSESGSDPVPDGRGSIAEVPDGA